MENSYPLVSIVITTFNRVKSIEKALKSALNQKYENIEIIISDNCSTDGTNTIISKYLSDSRIKYFKNDFNIGMWANFKKAYFERATGAYLLNISSDDYLINNDFVSEGVALFQKYSNISIVWGLNESKNISTGKTFTYKSPQKRNIEYRKGIEVFLNYPQKNVWFGAGACLINMSMARKINKVYDVDLNLDLLLLGDVCFINKPSYTFTIHNNNATNAYKTQDYINELYMYVEKSKLGIIMYPLHEINIKQWLDRCLYLSILDISKMLILKNKNLSLEFMHHIKINYPKYHNKTVWNISFNLRKVYSFIIRKNGNRT